MKKKTWAVIILAAMLAALPALTASAWIGDRHEDPDAGFSQFLEEVKQMGEYDFDSATWEKETLYNTEGEEAGLMYAFTLDDADATEGVVFMAKLVWPDGSALYETTEIYFDAKSPYAGYEGTKLYPTFCVYVVENGGVYTEIGTGTQVPLAIVQEWENQGFGFEGELSKWDDSEYVYYDHKTDVRGGMIYGMPTYTSGTNLGGNTCAVIAGSCVIGYYDRDCTNLIPNYTPGRPLGNGYIWKGDSNTIGTVVDALYKDMDTNQTGAGTTVAGYKSGISKYASDHGSYSTAFTSCISGGSLNWNTAVSQMNAGRPIALFLNPYYNFTDVVGFIVEEEKGYDWLLRTAFRGSHVMSAYGTRVVTYYNSSNAVTRADKYLCVAGAMFGYAEGYIRVTDQNFSLQDAFSVRIY